MSDECNNINEYTNQLQKKEMIHKIVYLNTIKKIPKPNKKINFNTKGRLNICLIECRVMDEIEYVLNALLRVYDSSDIGLTIVCGTLNKPFVEKIVKDWINVRIINCGLHNLNRGTYSAMLKMPQFWEKFKDWSHVLIYQTDALIMKPIDDIYFQYDYIGAPWSKNNQWVKYCAGNGGFSLRNVNSMIKVCECHRNIPFNNINRDNEDGFFCSSDLLKFPPINTDMHFNFAVEEVFYNKPIGCHQLYRYLNTKEFNKLIEYIIERLYE